MRSRWSSRSRRSRKSARRSNAADFAGRNAICALPMNVCQLRSLNVPPGSDQERRTIIADELAEDWAELRNPMEFDFWEMEPARGDKSTDAFNVSVLAASRLWIAQLWRDCRQSGLDCWAIDGVPLAMARAVGTGRRSGAAGGGRWPSIGDIRTRRCASWATSGRCTAGGFTTVRSAACWMRSWNVFDVTLDEAQHLAESEGVAASRRRQRADDRHIAAGDHRGGRRAARRAGSANQPHAAIHGDAAAAPAAGRDLADGRRGLDEERWAVPAQALSLPVHIWKLAPEAEPIACAAGNRSAVFGSAAALSALAWRAA